MATKVYQGDLIQWESQGSYRFDQPKEITAVSQAPDGSTFVFVEGSTVGIPADQVVLIRRNRGYYGDWIMGQWFCVKCSNSYYPRQLWENQLEHPILCPNCSTELIYDEAE